MPTYEFRCPDGTIIERIYKISDAPNEIPSPKGDGMAVRIISGGAGLLFKGSGFYITDYGKDGKKDQRPAGDKEGSGSNAAESKASESKPSESKSSGDSSSSASSSSSSASTSGQGSAPAAPSSPAPSAKPDKKSD